MPAGGLSKEVGPKAFKLPVWGWLVAAAAGYFVYSRYFGATDQQSKPQKLSTPTGKPGQGKNDKQHHRRSPRQGTPPPIGDMA